MIADNKNPYIIQRAGQLIVLAGPTASGKTALSIALAQQLSTEIISADSRQFYREMSIGTAKPSSQEQQGITHYLIDSHSIHQPINASQFVHEAQKIIQQLFTKHKKILLVGGSGLFIDSLCYGIDDIPHDPEIQKQLENEFLLVGLSKLLDELKDKDPVFFNSVDKKNPRRIIRALEVIRITKRPFSEFRIKKTQQNAFNIHYFVLSIPRNLLYERINERVDHMIAQGLEEEARQLYPYRHLKALQTVGYTEWFSYFDGHISKQTCIEAIKQNSRRYAKRQITWFKRNKNAIFLPFEDPQTTLKRIQNTIK